MNRNIEELREIAASLMLASEKLSDVLPAIEASEKAANNLGLSFSGSWLGYPSRVYYQDFQSPPQGAIFKPEWGLSLPRSVVRGTGGLSGSLGDWREYTRQEIIKQLEELTGKVTFDLRASKAAHQTFVKAKTSIASILAAQKLGYWDDHLEKLEVAIDAVEALEANSIASKKQSVGQLVCRDQRAMAEGFQIPEHVMLSARMEVIRNSFCQFQKTMSANFRSPSH